MKIIVDRLRALFKKILYYERCSRKLALSLSVAVYIAFSPFVGFHTVMAIIFAWLFALNVFVLLAVSCFINNPWTMLPVYGAGHVVGEWLFWLCDIDGMSLNPDWVQSLNVLIYQHVGLSGISFWAFLIGGNLLGIVFAVTLYPIALRLLGSMRAKA